MRIVLDTSSLFYGFQIDGNNEYFTTRSVLEEVRGRKMRKSIELRIDLVSVVEPDSSSVEEVSKIAKRSGDLDQLSATDIGLIALSKDREALLLTNDLGIQNVCKKMGISFQSFGGKSIRDEIEWGYRCIGCHRRFNRFLDECPYCGNELKRYPKKRKPVNVTT